MSKQLVVEECFDGFRSGNQSKVLACLSDDVVWRLHGCQTFTGKVAFAANINNEDFCEMARLDIRELIETNDRIIAIGSGAIVDEFGSEKSFVFCEVFLFEGELACAIDTFHVWN